jgi:cytochrome c-type biogenesis protein CcmH
MLRRDFSAKLFGGLFAAATGARVAAAQGEPAQSLTGPMDVSAHRPVRLPSRPGAQPQLEVAGVRKLELGLKCQCTCSLDVHTCRTTDKSCPVSPAMHADVMSLVNGGYSAGEIAEAFVDVYGERVRMAPRAQGFNLVAYIAPFAALVAGGLFVAAWVARSVRAAGASAAAPALPVAANATAAELHRIDEALKDDGL